MGIIDRAVHWVDQQGVVAIDSMGRLGVVSEPFKQEVQYPGPEPAQAYVGVGLLDGKPWSSRIPTMLGRFSDFLRSGLSFQEWVRRGTGGSLPAEIEIPTR